MGMIRLGDVRYNAQAGAFEARVDVERDGKTYRYPCQVPGPLDMDAGWVSQNLTKHALRQSDSGQSDLGQSDSGQSDSGRIDARQPVLPVPN